MQNQQKIPRLPPMQYDFLSNWYSEVAAIRDRPAVAAEFRKLKEQYIAMMVDLYENGSLGEDPEAYSSLQSKLHGVDAEGRNVRWLRETWEADSLANLSLAIARELKPGDVWEIVETDEQHSVVTDLDRTIVFDMRLCDKLSAWE